MSGRRIIGLVLVAIGMVALLWGGVFWTDKDTILDAGPIEVTTEKREGFRIPPIVGGVVLIAGIVLAIVPDRRRT